MQMITRNLPMFFNILWFQACWFACVLIGNYAALVVLCTIILAYLLVSHLRSEIWLLAAICLLGYAVDLFLIGTGILQKPSGGLLPPLWLSVLWLAFATTINHSLRSLMDKRSVFLALALIGGPLCYKVGVELSEIQFGFDPWLSLTLIAAVWFVAGNAILMLYNGWKKHVSLC